MKHMRVLIISFLIFVINVTSAFAYDLVLPKEKRTVTTSEYAFFVGRAKNTEIININDERVYIASNGAFAHSIKLKEGENRIIVKSNLNTQIYRFIKEKKAVQPKPEIVEFEPKNFVVKKDNTPLRKTPIDYGMNRISHLFKDTNLIIDGEQGDFYRVFLSKDNYAWIAKEAVKVSKDELSPKFITLNSQTFKNASVHTIEFNEKLPYVIEENDSEILFKVYNPFVLTGSVYTVNIRKPQKYSYKTISSNGVYVFKVSELPSCNTMTLEGLNILVDAGHGGTEKGAIGCLGDKEKDINLLISNELKDILSLMGANVITTRECDANVSLEDRVKIAQENCANIFISVHLNSIPDIKMNIHKNKGTSVYYYNENSKILAKSVLNSVISSLKTRNDGVRSASFAVLRPTDYVGILVEVAYMTNPIDSVLYRQETFARQTAKAIADGILNYINE